MENLSGMSLDDVKVHRNSDKPAQLQAHAYAQGNDIHLASGQEKHLPHEAWHVVQQKQGRVKPTVQMKGNVNINDDAGLEKEADMMGAKAVQFRSTNLGLAESSPITSNDLPIQRMPMDDFREFQGEWDAHSAEGWNLDSEQAGVGHGAARHVDIDALGLMARLATGDTNGNPASMFFDSPWDLLAEILNENKGKINEWIEANTGGLVLRKEVSNLKVLVYDEASGGKGKFTPHVGDAKVIMVLNRTNTGVAANPREYYLVTAFPLVGVDYQEMSHNERRSAKNKEKKKKVSKGQKKHNKKDEKRIAKAVDKRLG
jgi:hypothetical protein